MKRVSVEQLVNWAYREQMVHAARPEALPVEAAIGYSPRLAASDMTADKVDGGGRADFAAHHDAYRVHEAVRALGDYRRQRSDAEIGMILARKMCDEIMRGHDRRGERAVKEAFISGRGHDGSEVSPHALEASVGAHDLFSGEMRVLPSILNPLREEVVRRTQMVIEWGMRARRPDWIADPHYGWERGRAVYAGGTQRNAARRHAVLFIRVQPSGDDPFEVEQSRGLYAVWADCMAEIRQSLASNLTAHTLTDKLPERTPWQSPPVA